MFYGVEGNLSFALRRRSVKVLTLILVAIAGSVSTVVFHSVTGNRILTPSLLGLESLLIVVQTALVFHLGKGALAYAVGPVKLLTDTAVMLVFAMLLFRWLDPHAFPDVGFSIRPQQGDFLYLLARYARAEHVVEFATSLGFSTIYLASALKDQGFGTVHGTELVPEKAEQAIGNLKRAGLSDHAEVLVGDARSTLAGLDVTIDLALIDGWPVSDSPSLSLQVLQAIEPRLRDGAIVVNDNEEEDFLDYVRGPANGYRTLTLPWKGSTEVSIRVRPS